MSSHVLETLQNTVFEPHIIFPETDANSKMGSKFGLLQYRTVFMFLLMYRGTVHVYGYIHVFVYFHPRVHDQMGMDMHIDMNMNINNLNEDMDTDMDMDKVKNMDGHGHG